MGWRTVVGVAGLVTAGILALVGQLLQMPSLGRTANLAGAVAAAGGFLVMLLLVLGTLAYIRSHLD